MARLLVGARLLSTRPPVMDNMLLTSGGDVFQTAVFLRIHLIFHIMFLVALVLNFTSCLSLFGA